MKENPELSDRLADLRERQPLKSHQNIATQIDSGDIPLSKWMLEHAEPEEYGEKVRIQHSGSIERATEDQMELDESNEKLRQKFEEDLKASYERPLNKKDEPRRKNKK